ncbi:flagellar hook protein FlgE [Tunturiibacter gelidoferens]|jgi:flagellar hook protein FlgE|uniref:Flagellar hook protein FlgE n=1 Tax=Tunturiibacter gelidiferens TaxID=3069689 RepID=A0A9X0QIN4_9BACT|nr:flagellar hook protein FlgE [Edaphobacter lichenicola]MBB5330839.1 flagellar hook protein FlgE [Edaphobacter lichenicola]
MGNFSIALSGLEADTTALNTIGNNLANLNTTAYKGQTTSFEDLFHQQLGESGAGDPIQVGSGTKVGSTSTDFSEGTLLPDANGNTSDMALDGNGFFIVEQNGQQSLTRAGNFTVGNSGSLTTQDGQFVLGYPATNGVVNTNTNPAPITLPVGATEGAQATQNISVTANLNSGATVGTTFTTPVEVFDSLGQSHQVTITYDKTATNTWSYSIALPAGDATGTPVNTTGTLTFDSSGNLTSPTGAISGISFPTMADGASDLTFNWNLNGGGTSPLLTQLASANSNGATPQDGFTSGNYTGFTVDPSGVIEAKFSNGNSQTIGQVAVANVANEQGLVSVGGNNFQTTEASGQFVAGVAGTGGRGVVDDSTLEQSNVNISTEFSNLIVAQRAFEANSKTVTTFDTISQDVIAMVR